MGSAFLPAAEHGFIKSLVIGSPHGEGVLRPDDESRPVAARLPERLLQRVKFRGGHANVDRPFVDGENIDAGIAQELLEALAEIVVENLPMSFLARRLSFMVWP